MVVCIRVLMEFVRVFWCGRVNQIEAEEIYVEVAKGGCRTEEFKSKHEDYAWKLLLIFLQRSC